MVEQRTVNPSVDSSSLSGGANLHGHDPFIHGAPNIVMYHMLFMARLRRTNRYCVDCGARLVYYARLSNPKAPNEHRVLVYACPDCTKDFEKPMLLSIRRNQNEDPLMTVEIEITQYRKAQSRNSGTKTK